MENKQAIVDSLLSDPSSINTDLAEGRRHYLDATRGGIFDPQAFMQKFPTLYTFLAWYMRPTVGLKSWDDFIPNPSEKIVVNMGCGTTNLHKHMVNVDFVGFPHVDILADFAKPLPIKTDSVDAVLSISVLEHIENHRDHVKEIARILKSGGLLFVATPFMYPYHGAPDDYHRWSTSGLKSLLTE